jgi:uncharacterized membrane protein YoaK (UPF0700 family)
MSALPQTYAAVKTAGLPFVGEMFDPDHDPALTLGAAACLAAVIIGCWPARTDRASVHPPAEWRLTMSTEPTQATAADRVERGLRRTMPDRVVDRAAQHATPTLLAVRDWLLVALSFSTGIYEAISFLTFGKVFSAAQTGNLVLLGVGALTHEPAGPNEVTVAIALAAFFAGAMLAMPILRAFDGDREIEDNNVFQVWPRRVSIVLAITLILQAGFLAVWVTAASPATLAYPLIGLSAFAMGLQMNAIRSLHVPGISVTAFTATFIDLASGIATWSLTAPKVRRLAGDLVSMVAGALLGDWMLSHAHPYAPVVPLIVIAVVISVASLALKPRGPSPAGEQDSSTQRMARQILPSPRLAHWRQGQRHQSLGDRRRSC